MALIGTSVRAVMIIDVLTSGVDAFDVIDRVRADPRTAAVPIVVLTGEAMTSDNKRRLYGQIDRVANKSELDRSTLLGLIHAAMSPEEREKDALGELILIVEDNETTLHSCATFSERTGYRTLEASSAEDALTLARAEGPQLILMDVQLPGNGRTRCLARAARDARDDGRRPSLR